MLLSPTINKKVSTIKKQKFDKLNNELNKSESFTNLSLNNISDVSKIHDNFSKILQSSSTSRWEFRNSKKCSSPIKNAKRSQINSPNDSFKV